MSKTELVSLLKKMRRAKHFEIIIPFENYGAKASARTIISTIPLSWFLNFRFYWVILRTFQKPSKKTIKVFKNHQNDHQNSSLFPAKSRLWLLRQTRLLKTGLSIKHNLKNGTVNFAKRKVEKKLSKFKTSICLNSIIFLKINWPFPVIKLIFQQHVVSNKPLISDMKK